MLWNETTLSHTTTVVTYRLSPLPSVSDERFAAHMTKIAASFPTSLNRADNIVSQDLRLESGGKYRAYLWSLYWQGVGNTELLKSASDAFVEDMRSQIEDVGVLSAEDVTTLEGRLVLE